MCIMFAKPDVVDGMMTLIDRSRMTVCSGRRRVSTDSTLCPPSTMFMVSDVVTTQRECAVDESMLSLQIPYTKARL